MRALFVFLASFWCGLVAAAPLCWPSLLPTGTGTLPVAGISPAGTYLGWWCPTPTGWIAVDVLATPTYQIKHPTVMPADPIARAQAYWALNVVEGNVPEHDAVRAEAAAALAAVRPPDPRWTVAPNSTYPTRPTYRIEAGALVLDKQRATVGEQCDCALRFVAASTVYCRPLALTAVVAVCRAS